MIIDASACYVRAGMPGVAYRIVGPAQDDLPGNEIIVCDDEDCDHMTSDLCWAYIDPETEDSETDVIVVMVGDDHKERVPVEELAPLPDDAYCRGCGQVGCESDVYD